MLSKIPIRFPWDSVVILEVGTNPEASARQWQRRRSRYSPLSDQFHCRRCSLACAPDSYGTLSPTPQTIDAPGFRRTG
jgi:hypothetical protein